MIKVLQYYTDAAPERQSETMRQLRGNYYDLLHIHGCWQKQAWCLARLALKQGTRLVISPQGQLESWVINEKYWLEKLPKKLLYQQCIVKKAYAVIVQGKMEKECLMRLGWNSRQVIIRNPQITSTITQQEANKQQETLYRKIMDSNPWELMNPQTRHMLRLFIKAGITNDKRWIDDDPVTLDANDWRQILCYAHQEHLTDIIKHGIRILNFEAPDIDVSQIPYFLPDGYEEIPTIEQTIGHSFISENERLLATFRQLKRLWMQRHLTISHLVELDKELRYHQTDEEGQLRESLKERGLYKIAARLMQLMAELTGLTEGFMLMPPLNDRQTRQMKRQIDNHMKI